MKFFLIPDMITTTVTENGYQFWYKEGRLHREDGPAVGSNYYLIHGRCKTQKVLEWAEQCDIDLDTMSDSDKLLLKIFINNTGDNYES
jgi:hypothetical protein